jgi:hypothetical protein
VWLFTENWLGGYGVRFIFLNLPRGKKEYELLLNGLSIFSCLVTPQNFPSLCYNNFMEKLEWQAPEYIHTEKTGDWYWIVGIISVSIFLISAILGDIIFGLLVLVSTFALSAMGFIEKKKSKTYVSVGTGKKSTSKVKEIVGLY